MDLEQIKLVIQDATSYSDILNRLKLNKSGGNYKKLKNIIKQNNLNINHFLTRKEIVKRANIKTTIPLEKILVKNSTYLSGNNIKNKLYKAGLKKPICEKCNQGEIWNGEKISLILNHKDGDHFNNEISNLEILCPNCNATLDTHCGKNRTTFKYKEKQKLNKKEIKKQNLENIKNKILNSNIDFSKQNWGIKVGKILGKSGCYSLKFVKKYFPELLK